MAITKKVIKLNHNEAIVKIVNTTDGAESMTIVLDEDLLKDNEELSGAAVKVNISQIENALADFGEISLVRNSVTILNMFENTTGFIFGWGGDSEENESDITVSFTKKGTVYIRLLKLQGFSPLFRPEQGVNL